MITVQYNAGVNGTPAELWISHKLMSSKMSYSK